MVCNIHVWSTLNAFQNHIGFSALEYYDPSSKKKYYDPSQRQEEKEEAFLSLHHKMERKKKRMQSTGLHIWVE